MTRPVVVATRSADKLREIGAMCRDAGVDVVDLSGAGLAVASATEDELEVHETFEANALAKARYFFSLLQRPVLADDSGLEVAALGGAPGVRSKRWAGRPDLSGRALDDANNTLLLSRLVGATDRTARYVCAAAYCDAHGDLVVRGETVGQILEVAAGGEGFGYDPLFWSAELRRSFGESSAAEKAGVSHRGRAIRALLREIAARR